MSWVLGSGIRWQTLDLKSEEEGRENISGVQEDVRSERERI